jgi:hypothetical protein
LTSQKVVHGINRSLRHDNAPFVLVFVLSKREHKANCNFVTLTDSTSSKFFRSEVVTVSLRSRVKTIEL